MRAAIRLGPLCGFAVGVLFSAGMIWVSSISDAIREAGCSSGMSSARRLFREYSDAHAGQYPRRLEDLDLGSADGDALRCPLARDQDRHAYLYIPPDPSSPDDTPVLLCWRHPRLLILTKGGSFVRRSK